MTDPSRDSNIATQNSGSSDESSSLVRKATGAGSWPTATYQEMFWSDPRVSKPGLTPDLTDDGILSLLLNGRYQSCIPAQIAHQPIPVLQPHTQRDAANAIRQILNLNHNASRPGGLDLAGLTALIEAMASARIENITPAAADVMALAAMSRKDQQRAQTGSRATKARPAMQTAALLRVTHHATYRKMPAIVLMEHAKNFHRDLFSPLADALGPRIEPGGLRKSTAWIGGICPPRAVFVPPAADLLLDAMLDWEAFASQPAHAPALTGDQLFVNELVIAALAHGQFETIHPFSDGNGRTGRALAQLMLRQVTGDFYRHRKTAKAVIPFSIGLLSNRQGYYGALASYRNGNITPLVTVMAQAVTEGYTAANVLLEVASNARQDALTLHKASQRSVLSRVIDALPMSSAVTAQYLTERTGISYTAANKALDTLCESGVLAYHSSGDDHRYFTVPAIANAIDQLLARCTSNEH